MAAISDFISLTLASAAFWEAVEYSAMGLVLVGVIGEIVADFSPLSKSDHWKHVIGKWSAILLAVALGIELCATVKTNNINDKNITELRLATVELGNSNSELHKFVDKNKREVADQINSFKNFANSQTDQANEIIKNLNEDEAKLSRARDDALQAANSSKKSLAEVTNLIFQEKTIREQLNKQLSDAKRDISTLSKVIDARYITDAQKSTLMAFLKDKPKGTLLINALNAAVDSKSYADEIFAVFKASGWNVAVEVTGYSYYDQGSMGNWINFGGSSIPETARIVSDAMKAAGIPMRDSPNQDHNLDITPTKVILNIGSKKQGS